MDKLLEGLWCVPKTAVMIKRNLMYSVCHDKPSTEINRKVLCCFYWSLHSQIKCGKINVTFIMMTKERMLDAIWWELAFKTRNFAICDHTFPLTKQRKEESEKLEECAADSCWPLCDLMDTSAGPCGNVTAVFVPHVSMVSGTVWYSLCNNIKMQTCETQNWTQCANVL